MTTLTRRRLFGLAAAGAGGLAVTSVGGPSAVAAEAGSGADFVPADLNLHLLRRATFGPTPSAVKAIKKQGRQAWIDKQLAPSTIDDSTCDQLVRDRFPRVSWTIPEARDGLEPFSWDLMYDLTAATIARAAWSKRQLFEVMVDFWSNHLNVTNPSDRVWDNRQDYDRQVIRKHALGRFEDMLIASATHPAMLLYLNNADSTKDNPNENYGRELLELHTVSVDGGYNEQDMRNSTLVMTGFGVNWERGTFRYTGSEHYRGPVSVMGFSDPNPDADGYEVGIRYLKYLANHPSTAHHIAFKLCQRFVSDTPDPALVDRLAQTYLNRGTAIVPVLRQLFLSKEFASSMGEKVRRRTRTSWRPCAYSATARTGAGGRGCRRWSGSRTASDSSPLRGARLMGIRTPPSTGSQLGGRSGAGTRICPWPRTGGPTSSPSRNCELCCPPDFRGRMAPWSMRSLSGWSSEGWRPSTSKQYLPSSGTPDPIR